MKVLVATVEQKQFDDILNMLENSFQESTSSFFLDHAASPRDCLIKLRNDNFDVVILDSSLTGEDPGKALAKIHSAAPRSSIIVISESQSEGDALELIRLGAQDVIAQSQLNRTELIKIIYRVYERSLANIQVLSQASDLILKNTFDGIVVLDLQNRIMLWNHAMERMFNYKHQEVLGKVLSDILANIVVSYETFDIDEMNIEIARTLQGYSFVGQNKMLANKGQTFHFQPYYSPLHSRSKRVVGTMIIFRDMTEKIKSALEISGYRESTKQLANSISKMIFISDSDGARNYFNKAWLDFIGIESNSLAYETWLSNMHPQDKAKTQTLWQQAVNDHSAFNAEYRMKRNDNSYRTIMESGTPLFGDDGEFLGHLGFCTDIGESGVTNYRQESHASQKISAPKLVFETISRTSSRTEESVSTMDSSPIGVWKLDTNFVITKAPPVVADQLGLKPADLVGKPFVDVVPSVSKEFLQMVLAKQETLQLNGQKIEYGDANGNGRKHVFWDLAAWPLKDKYKQVIGVCISTMEVEEKNVNDKQKEDFLATLVHDLKTPLIGADKTLELLMDGTIGDIDKSQSEVLTMLRRSNQGILRMVQNLIEVNRYDFSKPDLALESAFAFDIAADCVEELSVLANQRNIELTVELPRNHGSVTADVFAIRRVILNLLDNAIKFTPQGGSIQIWGEETPNVVSIFVKDSGIGVSEEELPFMFERFWRSQKGKGQAVGTGLGLYLCKQIMDAHEGEINAVSKEGGGTTMSISLPRRS